ncbi:MAG: DsbC family protein [Pseudohongiellaceae bacterium]
MRTMTSHIQRALLHSGLCLMLAVLATASHAQTPDQPTPPSQDTLQPLREKLQSVLLNSPSSTLELTPTPLANIYQVEISSGDILYADSSGNFLFVGDMFQLTPTNSLNLTEEKRKQLRAAAIAAVDTNEMIIYSPDTEPKTTLTIFTDVDCGFCRRLHSDIEQIVSRGVEVRYLAFPRGGMGSAAYPKMLSVWCSSNRPKSLTQAKRGQNLPRYDCDAPVLEHYALGVRLRITGTPALVTSDGTLIAGYAGMEALMTTLNLE